MDDSDMDISLASIVYDTVDNFKYDVAVEANFVDSAYESESDNSVKAIYSGYTDSSGISGCADPHAKIGPDPCNNFREIPFTLHESAGHNSIYLPVTINEIRVNVLLDTGSQATVVCDKLANILELKSEDFVYVKGATADTSNQAKTCPKINLEINNMIYNWHVLIAPIEEVNKITVNHTIKVKPWSGKFIKLPITCKFGNWKIFESNYFDNVFIPNTTFNVKDNCFTILILNLRENKLKLKCRSILGIITNVHDSELYKESPPVDATVTRGDSSFRDIGIQVNFDEIKINTIEISPLEEL